MTATVCDLPVLLMPYHLWLIKRWWVILFHMTINYIFGVLHSVTWASLNVNSCMTFIEPTIEAKIIRFKYNLAEVLIKKCGIWLKLHQVQEFLISLDASILINWSLSCSFHYISPCHSLSSRTSGRKESQHSACLFNRGVGETGRFVIVLSQKDTHIYSLLFSLFIPVKNKKYFC